MNAGQTINFKITTPATSYHIDIYRMGYYQWNWRASISLRSSLPPRCHRSQPACLTDPTTQLYDCGNWGISASWTVPSNAVSGIYIAAPVRNDTGGASQIVFVVRNDSSHSAILFQTSDETWQAYNGYGGHSVYGPTDVFDLTNRAYKVSYNRPSDTRTFASEAATWVFGEEYPNGSLAWRPMATTLLISQGSTPRGMEALFRTISCILASGTTSIGPGRSAQTLKQHGMRA